MACITCMCTCVITCVWDCMCLWGCSAPGTRSFTHMVSIPEGANSCHFSSIRAYTHTHTGALAVRCTHTQKISTQSCTNRDENAVTEEHFLWAWYLEAVSVSLCFITLSTTFLILSGFTSALRTFKWQKVQRATFLHLLFLICYPLSYTRMSWARTSKTFEEKDWDKFLLYDPFLCWWTHQDMAVFWYLKSMSDYIATGSIAQAQQAATRPNCPWTRQVYLLNLKPQHLSDLQDPHLAGLRGKDNSSQRSKR